MHIVFIDEEEIAGKKGSNRTSRLLAWHGIASDRTSRAISTDVWYLPVL